MESGGDLLLDDVIALDSIHIILFSGKHGWQQLGRVLRKIWGQVLSCAVKICGAKRQGTDLELSTQLYGAIPHSRRHKLVQ